MATRDGVSLATDLYRPAHDGTPVVGRFPTILYRTPYDRRRLQLNTTGHFFAARGYNVVVQDCRGRYDSDGTFAYLYNDPHEGLDGYDTVEWIGRQLFSDGTVGTTGVSYEGAIQQAMAIERPPNLTTQVIIDAGYNYWTKTVRNAGAFSEGTFVAMVFWLAATGKEAQADPTVGEALRQAVHDLPNLLRQLPLRRGATPLALAPSYEDWYFEIATRGDYNDFWRNPSSSFEEHAASYPDIPVLLLTSWYGHHAWANFEKRRALLAGERTQPLKLICGTWVHGYGTMQESGSGETDFGNTASLGSVDDYLLRWFDAFLKGHDTGARDWAPVRVFVMGGGTGHQLPLGLGRPAPRLSHGGSWRDEQEWPPGRSETRDLFLAGDGSLCPEPPTCEKSSTTYTFDPGDPVPTIGGAVQNSTGVAGVLYGGGFDQRGRDELLLPRDSLPLGARADVLVFRTQPLEAAVEVTGELAVLLHVSSSACDTDFTAKLIDEYPPSEDYPCGFVLNLCDSVVRMRYRDGRRHAELIEPNEIYEVAVAPLVTSNVFATGHRIRLDISSSSSPQFDVNPNTGGPLGNDRGKIVARNTVYHDRARPSRIRLVVVPC